MSKQTERQPLDLNPKGEPQLPKITTPVKLIGWILGGICAVGILFVILMVFAAMAA